MLEWILQNQEAEVLKILLAIETQEKFKAFVSEIRKHGDGFDDMTLVIIKIL